MTNAAEVLKDIESGAYKPGGQKRDAINPSHYKDGWSNGAEVIDITENLNFNRGNAVKYIARAGAKDPDKTIEDLEKAQWYLQRELKRLRNGYLRKGK